MQIPTLKNNLGVFREMAGCGTKVDQGRFFSLHHTFHIISNHKAPNNRRSCHSAHGPTLCIHNKSRDGVYS